MAYYPVNLNIAGRKCLIVGGGEVAERKALSLLAASGVIAVCSPAITPELSRLAQNGTITHINAEFHPVLMEGVFLIICATNNTEINRLAAEAAHSKGILVNVADQPDLGNFTVPAQVAHGDLLLTVSTGGKSPALAGWLRRDLLKHYGPEYGLYLELISRLRQEFKEQLATPGERQAVWRESLNEEVFRLLAAGKLEDAEEKIRNAVGGSGIKS
ncbi:MAG: siroheme synthase [Firmicutes bacterium]|nr:siroheme synthase [Bacillota bacterium]